MTTRPIVLGLTGGIATGKSTVLKMFHLLGAEVIDTDEIVHRLLRKGTDVWRAVVGVFGDGILEADGTIDRKRLGDIVFADESKRLLLNRLVHPQVQQEWFQTVDKLKRDGFCGVIVVCVPLLFEVKAERFFNIVVAVACLEKTQVERLRHRGLDETRARQRIASQMPMREKMERADYVIWNEAPMAVLEQQVRIVWERVTAQT